MAEPVTPDREALVRAGAVAMANVMRLPEWMQKPALGRDMTPVAERVVDALLPLLTDALDRARQQGKREGREEAAEVIEMGPILVLEEVITDELWRGAHYAQHQAARLARGGPNRKDEE